MDSKHTRRDFIKKTGAVASLAMMTKWAGAKSTSDRLGPILPQRRLTRDGQMVSAFNLGGYHIGFARDPKIAEELLDKSMELGVRFYDNARGYHNGLSEEYMGKYLTPKYRDEIFLMTKSPSRTGKGAREHLEESLKALNTDYLDLWQIHAVRTPEDVEKRIENGVLDVFLEAKEKGITKYIGFTGHVNPKSHTYFLKRLDELGIELDTCQMPLNVCDASFESFQFDVMPTLLDKEYGVIAMKTMAGGSLMGGRIDTTPDDIDTASIPDVVSDTELTHAHLHQYVYSLPMSSLCSGCRFPSEVEQNVAVLRNLKNLSESDMKFLEQVAKPYAGLTVENYKRVLS